MQKSNHKPQQNEPDLIKHKVGLGKFLNPLFDADFDKNRVGLGVGLGKLQKNRCKPC